MRLVWKIKCPYPPCTHPVEGYCRRSGDQGGGLMCRAKLSESKNRNYMQYTGSNFQGSMFMN